MNTLDVIDIKFHSDDVYRRLRRDKKIMSTWTRNCKVFIKTFGSPETARVVYIKDISDLAKILE